MCPIEQKCMERPYLVYMLPYGFIGAKYGITIEIHIILYKKGE